MNLKPWMAEFHMSTAARRIETPVGPRIGEIFERLEILGISSYLTQSHNQPDGRQEYQETVNIQVPVGTLAIVPSPNLWWLGHGKLTPDQIDPQNDNQTIHWDSADRPWALGRVHVAVVDINAPDFSTQPATQSAQLQVFMRLIDYNADDPWFGFTGYTLTFLGRPSRTAADSGTRDEIRFQRRTMEMKRIR